MNRSEWRKLTRGTLRRLLQAAFVGGALMFVAGLVVMALTEPNGGVASRIASYPVAGAALGAIMSVMYTITRFGFVDEDEEAS